MSCATRMRRVHLLTCKMPAETPNTPAQTEKPHHYTYLKEFRTQQCPLFLQHKCTQHRPYTCFHWHFMNQRRRRPVKKRDGTFNYSPDVYCTKYDETTGICPDGDDCPLLHRTAGDTERRYHLRYYKTCTCVYETDARGHCVKNGAHCAFAHGAQDLRPPSYDVRELQAMENAERQGSNITDSPLGSSLEKDRIINEDPRWNDTNYVLANYKTEQCKRPPRLCRQGYACPSYHNTRDRRRSPKKFKYRSTPCPNVKHGDDWGDPTQCENADGCAYCHTRTEQQFHPEIYKSTKCNDMVQTGYCPRGPFCAFAHVEQEMTTQRDVGSPNDTSLAAFLKNALHDKGKNNHENENDNSENDNGKDDSKNINMEMSANSQNNGDSRITTNGVSLASSLSDINVSTSLCQSFPEPIGKRRTNSMSSSVASENSPSNYHKAPGSEREDCQAKLRHKLQSIENDPQLDTNEKSKRKQNLLLLHSIGSPGMMNTSGSPSSSSSHIGLGTLGTSPSTTAAMSPHAPSFYPAGETVESVIGNALDEDLNLGELSLSSLDREISRDNDNDTNSVCSSLSTGFPATNTPGSESYHYPPAYLGATSVPVTIPSGGYQRNSLGSLSQSPSSSPLQVGSLPLSFMPPNIQQQQQKQEQQIQDAAAAFLSQPNPGKFSAPGYTELNSMSPRNTDSISQSPLLSSSAFGSFEFQRMREELINTKTQRAQWEECIIQARNACEAWKKEAEEANKKAKLAHEECQQAIKQRDEAVAQVAKLKQEVDQIRAATILGAAPFLSGFARSNDMDNSTQACVKQVQKQLKMELDKLDVLCPQLVTQKCCLCQKTDCEVRVLPCNHLSLCNACTSKCNQCPICRTPISQSFVLPM